MATKGGYKTIDEYIASFPEPIQERLQTLRQTIREEAPQAQEAMKYAMPTFILHGNLVYFAAWKHHIGFYPITAEMEAELDELAAYNTSGKGTIQFPYDQPLPLPLIRQLVAFRVRENIRNKDKKK
jgi:uncharacterized protein YdhG (YjbR/CyaY superfamily)